MSLSKEMSCTKGSSREVVVPVWESCSPLPPVSSGVSTGVADEIASGDGSSFVLMASVGDGEVVDVVFPPARPTNGRTGFLPGTTAQESISNNGKSNRLIVVVLVCGRN